MSAVMGKPERVCCDGLCNENQGRGTCPRCPVPTVEETHPLLWLLYGVVGLGTVLGSMAYARGWFNGWFA